MNSKDDNTYTSKDLFLDIDRQADLGRLARGVVHALNNILAVLIGQLDIMVFNPAAEPVRPNIEKLIESCEEGTEITRSLMQVTNALLENDGDDTAEIVKSLLKVLERMFRKDSVLVERSISMNIGRLSDLGSFTQSAFHAMYLGFASSGESSGSIVKIGCLLDSTDTDILLTVVLHGGEFTAVSNEDLDLDHPPSPNELNYHYWMLDKLCKNNGYWEFERGRSILKVQWQR